MQWLYNAYEKVDAYPKAFPKPMEGMEASGQPLQRVYISLIVVMQTVAISAAVCAWLEHSTGFPDTATIHTVKNAWVHT